MRFIYKIAAITCFFALFFVSACEDSSDTMIKKKKVLIMATTADYQPFEFIKDKKIRGFDIDLAHILTKRLGYSLYIKDMNFDSIILALQTGEADFAMAGFTATAQREKYIDFSIPYFRSAFAIIYNKNLPISSIDDFKNKKIGVQLGTTMEVFIKEQEDKIANLQVISLPRIPAMIQELKNHRLDGVMTENIQAKVFVDKYSELDYTVFSSSDESYVVAFPKNSALKEQFDKILIALRDSGELDDLKRKWLFK